MNKKQITVVAILIVAAIAVTLGLNAYNQKLNQQQTLKAQSNLAALERSDAPVFGAATAKVTIVEFFDPACETCKTFYPLVKTLIRDNPGRVKSVLRYAPLHPGSDQVVMALEAARLQNLFWPALEALFNGQGSWASHTAPNLNNIWPLLQAAGVNEEQARKDMASPKIEQNIARDVADMETLGVKQTPEFFVNGKPMPSFSAEALQQLVADELKLQYGKQ
ncbi:MAG: thioredoxin domain-containing protein [Polaromonas sp.]